MLITGNGTFPLEQGVGWSATALYPTALGGATVKLQRNGVDLVDGALSDNTQIVVYHGKRANIDVVVTGYTADITIETFEV